MGRNKINESDRKTKIIRFLVTEKEFKIYQTKQNRLSIHSPTLLSSDIFRFVSQNIDDKALIQFLDLYRDDPIRQRLEIDFIMERQDD